MTTGSDPLEKIKGRISLAKKDKEDHFDFDGRDYLVHPDVFPPTHFQSTSVFSRNLNYPVGGAFWEIGCGVGVTAIEAAFNGCRKVLASDISPLATKNTLENAQYHNVSDVVSVRCGDLFDVLSGDERFDVIYWNSNFVYVPEGFSFEDDYHRAFADEGYKAHDQFFRSVFDYLTENGKVYLGFSSQGDMSKLDRLLEKHNISYVILYTEKPDPDEFRRYDILEISKSG